MSLRGFLMALKNCPRLEELKWRGIRDSTLDDSQVDIIHLPHLINAEITTIDVKACVKFITLLEGQSSTVWKIGCRGNKDCLIPILQKIGQDRLCESLLISLYNRIITISTKKAKHDINFDVELELKLDTYRDQQFQSHVNEIVDTFASSIYKSFCADAMEISIALYQHKFLKTHWYTLLTGLHSIQRIHLDTCGLNDVETLKGLASILGQVTNDTIETETETSLSICPLLTVLELTMEWPVGGDSLLRLAKSLKIRETCGERLSLRKFNLKTRLDKISPSDFEQTSIFADKTIVCQQFLGGHNEILFVINNADVVDCETSF